MNAKELDKTYIAPTYQRFDLLLTRGQGSELYDEAGKRYIDLGSGIAVNLFGAADPVHAAAVTAQLHELAHACNYYYTEPQSRLAELLIEKSGMRRVFFGNSGAEANECAIKAARLYGEQHGCRHKIITLKNSFHGRTIATLAATGQDVLHAHFGPFPEGFVYADADDLASVRGLSGGACAVMMELIQGEGGVLPLDESFVKGVAALCREKDMLLIIDEVQTGNGRTGHMFAYQHYGITPDIVTTAKGLGGGLPIGACLMGERGAVLTTGLHGSTFGGNPVCCAGAISVVERLTEDLFAQVWEKGEYVKSALVGAKGVKSITGLGLMLGIEIEKNAHDVAARCIENGLLVLTAKEKVRLLPALNIPFPLLAEGVCVLRDVLSE